MPDLRASTILDRQLSLVILPVRFGGAHFVEGTPSRVDAAVCRCRRARKCAPVFDNTIVPSGDCQRVELRVQRHKARSIGWASLPAIAHIRSKLRRGDSIRARDLRATLSL